MKKLFLWTGNVIRDTGVALERAGMRIQGDLAFKEQLCNHRRLMNLYDSKPFIGQSAWVAPTAALIGDVVVGAGTTVWYGAVIRGDVNKIRIGDHSVIGDRVVIHVSSGHADFHKTGRPTTIGSKVYIGQGALIHACTIEDGAKVEPGAIILDGAVVGKRSIVAAGSLVPSGKTIGVAELWGGNPAKFIRALANEEMQATEVMIDQTLKVAIEHDKELAKTEEQREQERHHYRMSNPMSFWGDALAKQQW